MMFASCNLWLKGSTIYIRKKCINNHSMLFCLTLIPYMCIEPGVLAAAATRAVWNIFLSFQFFCSFLGLIYLIGKYFMDRYNLYYAYKPSKINHHIHTSAINFVIIALIILQFNMLFYNTIRTSKSILSQYNLISPRQQCPVILCLSWKILSEILR